MSTFWHWFWLVIEIFLLFAYLIVLFQIVGDLFRDRTTGGLAKALWVLFLIALPLLGALTYLLVRGKGMTTRSIGAANDAVAAQESYIRSVAGSSPASEIAKAHELLASGAITDAEFADLKARVLASR